MKLFLLRHGQACPASPKWRPDSKRPLTREGEEAMFDIARGMQALDAHQLSLYTNFGRLFENLIYLDLRRRGDEIYYYLTNERYEVDFLTKSLDGEMHLYQVAWNMDDPETKFREERALQQAEHELNIKGEIITAKTYFDWLKISR